MVVLQPETTEFGHSIPPETKYSITTNARGWDTAVRFREGDMAVLQRVVHLYPRFGPRQSVAEVSFRPVTRFGHPPFQRASQRRASVRHTVTDITASPGP